MKGLALFRRNRQPQSLIKAPSADLIKSDAELVMPELEDIQCELTIEELEQYSAIANALIGSNRALRKERSWHDLKLKGFKNYPPSKVNLFMTNQISHIVRKKPIAPDMWWSWIKISDYKNPIPPRIIKTIEQIGSDYPFSISDIVHVTYRYNATDVNKNTSDGSPKWNQIINKRLTEVCFLRMNLREEAWPEESLIIDAWRGPTFSDEEAKI
jgi:hypothetical protein